MCELTLSASDVIKSMRAAPDQPIDLGVLNLIHKEHEINYQISCFYDEGFTVMVGDKANGFTYRSALCDTFEDAVSELIDHLAEMLEEQPAPTLNGLE